MSCDIVESLHDWRSHICDGFIFARRKGNLLPIYVNSVARVGGSAKDSLSIRDIIVEGNAIIKSRGRYTRARARQFSGDSDRFLVGLPLMGMAEYGDGSCYVTYKANRQWKKSVRKSILSIQCPIYDEILSTTTVTPDALFCGALYTAVNKVYTQIDLALRLVEDGGVIARPIGQHFAVTSMQWHRRPLIVYKDLVAGYFLENGGICIAKKMAHIRELLCEETGINQERLSYE